ncbi:hypothetical protein VTH8203_01364 [Vibrio thalassae]|uniref:Uncharacterized protein n=1 Tax=Vibrio thalassae TaxID=1243014 RepID=A0A240EHT5_9VIBR|nr:hypothetical protein [Vibrio thalassae]SNX47749.1 hypothetical protein VTH8203_01364 [Vibrio thalassae]
MLKTGCEGVYQSADHEALEFRFCLCPKGEALKDEEEQVKDRLTHTD